MTREEVRERILKNKVVAVVRTKNPDQLSDTINALVEGGVIGIELTMTIPNAIDAIAKAAKEFGNKILLGVGSVTTADVANRAIDAGANFVVSPVYDQGVVDATIAQNKLIIPAGFTPTEIQNAYLNGADFVKIFPADNLGMSFIKSIKAPLPHLNVIPTGGVTIDNAIEWINHGASAVGIGSALVDNKAIETENYELLTEKAKKLCSNLGIN
jgi:2-dehydro-3-deoxyphosphogluconate aldolase/(4S)-4-hydroxy-2-oxoglutarate aldolase